MAGERGTPKKRMTKEMAALTRGVAMALAEVARSGTCQIGTIGDVLSGAGMDEAEMRAAGVDDYDLDALRPHIEKKHPGALLPLARVAEPKGRVRCECGHLRHDAECRAVVRLPNRPDGTRRSGLCACTKYRPAASPGGPG